MHRPLKTAVLLLPTLLLPSLACAQGRRCDPGSLRVKVMYANSRSVHNHTEVQLLTNAGLLIKRGVTDDSGNVDFNTIPASAYHLKVQDPIIEDYTSDQINIDCGENRNEMISVKLKGDAEVVEKQLEAKEAMISALDLNVPSGARKEFEKGANALEEDKRPEAEKHFLRAIELYPNYAMAYNHLGVLYMQNGDQVKGREMFEKAVALNDHYPSALLNLAKLRYQDKKLPEAEDLLRKAASVDTSNAEILALLANAEFINGHVDEGLANTVKMHALAHGLFAGLHYVAAQALEGKNRYSEAIAQYTLFLQEVPAGAMSNKAKLALGRLHAQSTTPPLPQQNAQNVQDQRR
jgi:tetratricopeptide (TPR) repeat protein